MKKVYYAHSILDYNTEIEKKDISLLENMGFVVFNPNNEEIEKAYKKYKEDHINPMEFFNSFVDECDLLAFRSLPNGFITSGVVKEINRASMTNKPIIELPNNILNRQLSIEQTLNLIKESKYKEK